MPIPKKIADIIYRLVGNDGLIEQKRNLLDINKEPNRNPVAFLSANIVAV